MDTSNAPNVNRNLIFQHRKDFCGFDRNLPLPFSVNLGPISIESKFLMTCRYCPLLPEFTCSNCEQPLCYPCALKAYICDHTREENIALNCSQCNEIFKTKDRWLLRISKLQYWDTENPTRPSTVS